MEGISKSFPGVKALDNVDFALRKGDIHALVGENGAGKSTLMKVITGVYEEEAQMLDSLGIPASPTQELSSCSLAVQQMIAIARAVDMDCKILILDEPTSSLDEDEARKLFELMRELKARGVGIIFITHFINQGYEISDRVTVVRNGGVIGEKPPIPHPPIR